MEKGKERPQGTSQEDDVIAVADGAGEGLFVGIQASKDAVKDGVLRGRGTGGFKVPIELEEFREEGENEGKGYLGLL